MNAAAISESVGREGTTVYFKSSSIKLLSLSHAARHLFSTTGNLLQIHHTTTIIKIKNERTHTHTQGERKYREKTTVSWLARIQRALILQEPGICDTGDQLNGGFLRAQLISPPFAPPFFWRLLHICDDVSFDIWIWENYLMRHLKIKMRFGEYILGEILQRAENNNGVNFIVKKILTREFDRVKS